MADILTVHGADMIAGETRIQGFAVTHEGVAVTPANATYQRYRNGTAIDAVPVAASINTNQVYANIPAGTTAGNYNCYFYYTVDTETVITRVQYKVLTKS